MHIDHFKEHFQPVTDQRQSAKITYCLFEVLFGSSQTSQTDELVFSSF